MGEFLRPETHLVGVTGITNGLMEYLTASGNAGFINTQKEATLDGLAEGEILSSVAAKLCYKSLSPGQNANVTKTRDVQGNLEGCIAAGHSSVWGHLVCNFITRNCSRLFTHELIRHEAGTDIGVPDGFGVHEWSQTSGRYVRLDKVDLVLDPILDSCRDLAQIQLEMTEETIYLMECRTGLRKPPRLPVELNHLQATVDTDPLFWQREGALLAHEPAKYKWVPNNDLDFGTKKKITSAIRRFAPNGQVNEIFWTANVRALRHMIQMRTSRHAEWEIRLVFGQVFDLVRKEFAVAFSDAKVETVDGLPEVTGMRTQPYQEAPR